MRKEIVLSQCFGKKIFTRNSIIAFFEEFNSTKESEIVLDFKGVEFISRSCADEYLKQKEKTSKKILEANITKDVYSMFNVVKNQYKEQGFKISYKVMPSSCDALLA